MLLQDKYCIYINTNSVTGQFQAHSAMQLIIKARKRDCFSLMVTEELKSKKGQTDVSHHRTFDDTKAAAVAHWLPLKAADCSATVGPIPRQFHTVHSSVSPPVHLYAARSNGG